MRIRILRRVIKRETHLHLVYTGAPSSIKKLVPPFEGGKSLFHISFLKTGGFSQSSAPGFI
jgi:hypothetical protein